MKDDDDNYTCKPYTFNYDKDVVIDTIYSRIEILNSDPKSSAQYSIFKREGNVYYLQTFNIYSLD